MKKAILWMFVVIAGLIMLESLIVPGDFKRDRQAELERSIEEMTAKPTAEPEPPKPSPEPAWPDLELLEFEGQKTQSGGEITGSIRNNTGKKYSYVQAVFVLLDNDGNQVGSATANINGLEPGRTWKFKALALTEFDRFKLDAITGF